MSDAMHFNRRAELYSRSRPPYPADLWSRVRATGLVGPGRRALDLGAGTGEATGTLLDDGMDVVAVEPGPDLAAILAQRYPAVDVRVTRAEDVDLADGSFDLVVAATSIHWMDPGSVLPKVHRALAPGGRFLVWRNVFGDPFAEKTPFRSEVDRIVERRATERPGDPEDVGATADTLTRDGLFAVDDIVTYRWSMRLGAAEIKGLFSTFSDWSAHEVDEAVAAVHALGGQVIEHYTSWLIVASPRHGPPLD